MLTSILLLEPLGLRSSFARELETEDDPKRFKERLAKVVKHKPVPGRPE